MNRIIILAISLGNMLPAIAAIPAAPDRDTPAMEVGGHYTLTGRLEAHRCGGFANLTHLDATVRIRTASGEIVEADEIALMDESINLVQLTRVLGNGARVTVEGILDRPVYAKPPRPGEPTEILVTRLVTVRGKPVPSDLPLSPTRIQTRVNQAVLEYLAARIGEPLAPEAVELDTVPERLGPGLVQIQVKLADSLPAPHIRSFMVDVIDASVSELK